MKTGVELIAEERRRQIEEEGWTSEHDDKHKSGEMIFAGVCYAINFGFNAIGQKGKYRLLPWSEMIFAPKEWIKYLWPFEECWWKPKDNLRDLIRAGALIAAEIDRIQRL